MADAPPTAIAPLTAAADAAAASTAWSPARWSALEPAQARMADVLPPWSGAAVLGLEHGSVLGVGSQGQVTQLKWSHSVVSPAVPADWPRYDGCAPAPGAALAVLALVRLPLPRDLSEPLSSTSELLRS